MAAGKPLASYENPAYTGPNGLAHTTMLGQLHELTARSARAEAIITLESQTVAGGGNGVLNLRYNPNNQGTQPVRSWSNPAWLASVNTNAAAIVAAAKHQEIQQD